MEQPKPDPDSERGQLREALERERNMLRAIIDSIPDLVFVKDRDGRFVGACRDITDKKRHEADLERRNAEFVWTVFPARCSRCCCNWWRTRCRTPSRGAAAR
jgi:PAS domain-containing protein